MTATQIDRVNNTREIFRVVGLGTRLDAMEYGTIATPAVGTLVNAPIVKYSIAPANTSNTAVHAAVLLAQTVTTTVTTGFTNPDFPRNILIKGVTNVTGDVVINGTDFNGTIITETIASNGASVVVGALAFKTVTSVVLPPYAVAGTENISIGYGVKFGMPKALPNAGLLLVKSFSAGAADTGTLTASATLSACVFAINGTPDGTKVLDLYFIGV
jgi:hypothetical protein